MANIFISYQRESSAVLAHLLKDGLEKRGFSAFLDIEDMENQLGLFPERLKQEIERSDYFVCLLGENTLQSKWVEQEILTAYQNGKYLVPIFQEGFIQPTKPNPVHIDALLYSQGIDFLDRRGIYFEAGIDKLANILSSGLFSKSHIDGFMVLSPTSVSEWLWNATVDGTSDQYYFSAIKTYLISRGLIRPPRELVFLPSGSFKGIKAVVPIIAGLDEKLPHIVLDCDPPGRATETQLKSSLYVADQDRIIMLADVCGIEEAEVEDLIPTDFMAHVVTRYLRGHEVEFTDVAVPGHPMVGQIEQYAEKYGKSLEKNVWKVELAKLVKERFLQKANLLDKETEVVERWKAMFEKFST